MQNYRMGYNAGYSDGVKAERERWKVFEARHEALLKAISEFMALHPQQVVVIPNPLFASRCANV